MRMSPHQVPTTGNRDQRTRHQLLQTLAMESRDPELWCLLCIGALLLCFN